VHKKDDVQVRQLGERAGLVGSVGRRRDIKEKTKFTANLINQHSIVRRAGAFQVQGKQSQCLWPRNGGKPEFEAESDAMGSTKWRDGGLINTHQ
jgi:hypothetical protein